ncbi:MAG TPA: hypothetical protein VF159_03645 [Gemmatimonadaceae bacterium]
MRRIAFAVSAATLILFQTSAARAQVKQAAHAARGTPIPRRSPQELRALYQAHRGDFDYLLGDWQFTAKSREYPSFHGVWSATKFAEGGQILDEYRITGDSGETYYVSSTIRSYDANLDCWELISTEQGRGLRDFGTGRREGAEMHIDQTFGVGTPSESLWRIRYFNIGPDHFSWSADRSTDGGKTWVAPYQTIEATRIGPARSLEPLSKPKR